MRSIQKAYLFAGMAALFWSTAAAAFKKTLFFLQGNVVQTLLFSVLVSFFVLLLTVLVQKKTGLMARMTMREVLRSALLGLLNPFLYYLVLFKAYSVLPGQEAQPLNFTWPVVLTLLSVPLLKQRMRPVPLLSVCISFMGVLIISTQGRPFSFRFTHPAGAALALGSSVMWALYWIYNRRDGRDAVVKLTMNFAFGLVYLTLLAVFTGDFRLPPLSGFLGMAWIGIFEMGMTFVVWLKALEIAERASMVANLVYLCPFLALIWLRVVVGEMILPSSVVGLCFIVAGIVVQARKNKADQSSANA